MKSIILKTISGISLLAFLAMTFSITTNASNKEIKLENIIALNSANAEGEGGSVVVCVAPWTPVCAKVVTANGSIMTIKGTAL